MPSAKRSKIIIEFKNFPCKIIFSGTSKVTAADCVLRDFTTVNGPKFPVEDDGHHHASRVTRDASPVFNGRV